MVLVLDNAPYHHARDENFIDPLQLRRDDLIKKLMDTAGRQTITVKRGEVDRTLSLREAIESKKGGSNSPYVRELQSELFNFELLLLTREIVPHSCIRHSEIFLPEFEVAHHIRSIKKITALCFVCYFILVFFIVPAQFPAELMIAGSKFFVA